jgi:hypothetical protein
VEASTQLGGGGESHPAVEGEKTAAMWQRETEERERVSWERERKGKNTNLSSPFTSMVAFIFLVFISAYVGPT